LSELTWLDVSTIENIPDGDAINVDFGAGRSITLYRVGEEVFATAGLCTHGAARMCDGFLEGYEIECPLHQGRFDIRTGKALNEPLTEDIRTYDVRCESGRVFVALDS
jgi:naphthalene 1,2-dioxygenase system ferredoxin subunit